ncbi:hypothetical protein CDS [Bradyrhizobium sp.]|nr:hypothetical protein CDS [Bradyrhizobium sp.]
MRDTLLERPIRDVDLFLDADCTDEAAKLLRSQHGFVKVGEWKNYEMFSDPAVKRVAKFEKADETTPVCLIGLHYPSDTYYDEPRSSLGMQFNLSRFDFGICMAGWDGNEVYTAPEYRRDLEAKTFTLCRADDQPQFNYSMARFLKMTADRYAGWRLIVPAAFEHLARQNGTSRRLWQRSVWVDDEFCLEFPSGGLVEQVLTPKPR